MRGRGGGGGGEGRKELGGDKEGDTVQREAPRGRGREGVEEGDGRARSGWSHLKPPFCCPQAFSRARLPSYPAPAMPGELGRGRWAGAMAEVGVRGCPTCPEQTGWRAKISRVCEEGAWLRAGLLGGRWDGASKDDRVTTEELGVTIRRTLGAAPRGHRHGHAQAVSWAMNR